MSRHFLKKMWHGIAALNKHPFVGRTLLANHGEAIHSYREQREQCDAIGLF